MSAKTFNTRFQLKYDTYENWNSLDNQFKLLKGEIAIAEIPSDTADVPSTILFKVGDGINTFKNLPLVSALGADVPNWAKKRKRSDNETAIADDAFVKALDDIEALKAFFSGDESGEAINILEKLLELEQSVSGNTEQLNTIAPVVENHTTQIKEIQDNLMPKAEIFERLEDVSGDVAAITDRVETFLDSNELNETIDTLYEIQNWINGDGVNTTELTEAIAIESNKRAALEETVAGLSQNTITRADFNERVETLEGEIATVSAEKASTAKAEAVAAAKEYADEEITKLATVAKTGKISDLIQSENEEDYVIFNCGTSKILVKDPSEITYQTTTTE